MRWEDERYVRLYTRDTPEWCALSFGARGLFCLLMRAVDRAGILPLGKLGPKGVAVAARAAWVEVEPLLDELLKDGCVTMRDEKLFIPNFMAAQEAIQTDAARKRASRERARAAFGGSTAASETARTEVTRRDTVTSQGVTLPESHGVTKSLAPVTLRHVESLLSDPSLSEPSLATQSPNGRAHVDEGPAKTRARVWPESGFDLFLRVWDELWSVKYRRAYVHSTHTGPKSETSAAQKLGALAIERAHGSPHHPETFVRHWVGRYLKDPDAWPSDNGHPLRGLESRLNKYGDPKRPRPVAPPKPEPPPEPPRPFTPLPKVSGPPIRKPSTPDELKAKAEADKARLAAIENGKG